MGKRAWDPGGGAVPAFRGSTNVHVLVNLECHVCAFISELLSLPAEKEEGDSAVL